MLKEEKITLHDAIRAAHNPQLKKEILDETLAARVEVEKPEKPRIEEISAGEERIEETEVSATFGKESGPKNQGGEAP